MQNCVKKLISKKLEDFQHNIMLMFFIKVNENEIKK